MEQYLTKNFDKNVVDQCELPPSTSPERRFFLEFFVSGAVDLDIAKVKISTKVKT